MKKERIGELLRWYMREHKRWIWLVILLGVIYGSVFYLYNVPVEAAAYGTVLGVTFLLVMNVLWFWKFCRKHQKRMELIPGIEYAYRDMPEADTLAEKDYQQMVMDLGKSCYEHLEKLENQEQESKEYYTIWVHQIKTPIAVMRMILQEEDTRQNRELLAELFRIEQYAEMALSYIRLESSESDFVIKEYNLDDIIRQAIHRYAPQFIRRKLRLVYEPTEVKVLTDEKWLLFILEQIISNAVKYTPSGTITIRVTEDKKLSVEDTGIGIAPEDLPRIFEKGFTGYNGRNDKKATGLGLNLCRKAAEYLNIGIAVESKPGVGSCFTLDLKERQFNIE